VGPPLIGSVAEAFTLRGALAVLALFGALIAVLGATSLRAQPAANDPLIPAITREY
ncbi:MAG: hypothetical protein H7Y32_06220, partial [Chloroflexales bacterium]|nr:hypothetical protein [Chloroflexales bacterium]